ncbi:hypothetical protein SAMN05443634_102299 [Chishuiella changwenlii]|uniref:Lipoprotein n=1 Tax=Chishuiella changwenlii TaxID=1434701 RepID=A0A1M6UBS3_9FLAO|nr:hypothetical protein [Chishuiella changwenlii]GGE99258.1 hypothetical protein GCM10010984_16050 [Chishuiella changwenlii]SHK66610.1 hypothetical protein SAMN05443634_102299 [Chishuiella changwenlii]
MKNLLVIFIIPFIFSCSLTKSKNNLIDQIISAYELYEKTKTNGDVYVALGIESADIYVYSKNDSVIQTPIYSLFYLHDKDEYKNYPLKNFIQKIIDKELIIDEEKFHTIAMINSFSIDNTLIKEYDKIGFEKFKNKYSFLDKHVNAIFLNHLKMKIKD